MNTLHRQPRDEQSESVSLVRAQRKALRAAMSDYNHRSTSRAMLIVSLDLAAYALLLGVTLSPTTWLFARILASIGIGIVIARLFIIGHDACHQSFTSSRSVNKIVGWLVFLPSLTPYSLWELGHNVAHHGFTNLKGHDYVWTPYSKQEFDNLPCLRRLLERAYRFPLGHGLYYLLELWWGKLIFPSRRNVPSRRSEHIRDSLIVVAYFLLKVAALTLHARMTGQPYWEILVLGFILPFSIWNQLMGFVIFVQHTHPSVMWFAKKSEWVGYQAQVASTPHVVFPLPFSALLHNIMEHTAHHVETKVPLYNLPAAQEVLKHVSETKVPVLQWSWSYFFNCTSRCKVYDFDRHRWLDFDGRPTSLPLAAQQLGFQVESKA